MIEKVKSYAKENPWKVGAVGAVVVIVVILLIAGVDVTGFVAE